MTTIWSASASLSANAVIAPTSAANGLFFRVTQSGTTGSTEPAWPTAIGETAYDNNVQYLSFSSTFSDIHSINPSAIIELFSLELSTAIHGTNTIYRFHNGSNLNANGKIVWDGQQYLRFPIKAEGFAFQKGMLPRPTLTVSNALGTITSILLSVNEASVGNDLTGATVTRIRTLARFIDAVNFPSDVNPYGTPDPTAEFPKEIYFIDRKPVENRNIVQFEMISSFDLSGIGAPKKLVTRDDFAGVGTFVNF